MVPRRVPAEEQPCAVVQLFASALPRRTSPLPVNREIWLPQNFMCAQLWFVFATSLPSVGENVSATGFPVVSALVRLLLCVPLPAAPSAQARGAWSRRVPAGHAVCGAAPRLLPSLPAWRRCGRRPAVLWGTDVSLCHCFLISCCCSQSWWSSPVLSLAPL